MAPVFRRYASGVSLAGAALVGALAIQAPDVPLGDWHFWLFAGLVLASELLPIDIPHRGGFDRVTSSTAFGFAALLLFGLFPAVLMYAVVSLIVDGVWRKPPLKAAFNAAQYALATAAAGAVMLLLGESLPIASVSDALPAAMAGAAAFFLTNHILPGIAVALMMGERPARYLVTDLGFQVMTLGFVLALAPIVVASAEASIVLVPLCVLPVFAVYAGARQATRDAHRAVHDALTDLPNRLLLHERVERALARARMSSGSVLLMIVDLDDFKAVNDTLGHAYGDRLLQAVGLRMQDALTEGDLLARLGGDEFAVLVERAMSAEEGRALGERLAASLETAFDLDGILLDVRASVGVACFPDHGDSPDELLRRADVALYCAQASQQTAEVYVAALDHYTVDRLLLAGQLRRGIEHGELVLEYQPKFPLDGGPCQGVEALARWEHPTLGRIGPDGFIPLAEHTGLMPALTKAVLESVIAQSGRWQRSGCTLRISVNVSPRSLLDRELPELIRSLLVANDSDPRLLQLEITESRPVPSGRIALAVLEELRSMGVGIAIDDFGTGFSSLVQLQALPVDEIKIDRSFVASMEDSASDVAIVRSTIDLARNLGLVVTAEGVESERVRRQLAEMGCELAQGYHLCRPLPADACVRAVARRPRLVEVGAA
jgi:diguanylate cyclase (GGDEF)-like protein